MSWLDDELFKWGTAIFGEAPAPRAKKARGLTGLSWPSRSIGPVGDSSKRSNATVIRNQLRAVARRTPEVLVKISGGGKGMRQIKDHLDYISRNGKIELENEDGDVLSGRGDLRALRDEWQMSGGFPIADEGTKREAFNIVLSMPAGTDPLAVKRAVRDFAAREFHHNHRFAMALHTFDTDPDRAPSKHPHVHLCVKARGFDGVRLNPRKADLQRWREGFAEALREHGIEASATKRQPRLQQQHGEKQSVRQMKLRGQGLERIGQAIPDQERALQAERTKTMVMSSYGQICRALARSEDPDDRSLAVTVVRRFEGQRDQEQQRYPVERVKKPDLER